MKTTFPIILLFILNSILFSQVTQEWVAIYRGPGDWIDYPKKILLVGSELYITGHSFGAGTFADFCTIKYNSSGIEQWIQRYDGPESSNDYARFIHRSKFGGFYVLGYTNLEHIELRYNSGITDKSNVDQTSHIIRYSESGNLLWIKDYPGLTYWCGAVDSLNNIFISGLIDYAPNLNFKTVKFDSAGNVLWERVYEGANNYNDEPLAAGVDISGNFFVTGYTSTGQFSRNRDIITIKYFPDGTTGWVKIYNAPANDFDQAYNLSIDHNNNIYVSGWSNRGFNNDQDIIAIKYDNTGNQVWVNRYNGNGNYTDCATASAVDINNNFYVTGYIYKDNVTGTDFCTIKYNPSGQMLWVKTYTGYGAGIDGADAIISDNYLNVFVTGSSWGNGTNYDFATIKYDSNGNQLWDIRYTSAGNYEDQPSDIKVNNTGEIFITGEANYRYTTLKYSQNIGINPISSEIPKSFSLSQNYPNPFNPTTKIRFALPPSPKGEGLGVMLIVNDILGCEVTTLVNEQLKPGIYEVSWDALNYPSGVYFYKIITNEYTESKKMILIK